MNKDRSVGSKRILHIHIITTYQPNATYDVTMEYYCSSLFHKIHDFEIRLIWCIHILNQMTFLLNNENFWCIHILEQMTIFLLNNENFVWPALGERERWMQLSLILLAIPNITHTEVRLHMFCM